MRLRLLVLCLLAALGVPAPATAHVSARAPIVHAIDHLRRETNRLRADSGRKPLATRLLYRRVDSRAYRLRVLRTWQKRYRRAWRSSVWVALARCESDGRWRIDGAFDGGLQFHPRTWSAYRPRGFPRVAYRATPLQQVKVARRVLAEQGWSAWPACSARLGLR